VRPAQNREKWVNSSEPASMPTVMRWADDPRQAARYAACAFALAGPLTILGAVLNAHRLDAHGASVGPIVAAGLVAILLAAIIPWLPWRRWNPRWTMVLPALALAMTVASEIGAGGSRTSDGAMSTASVVGIIFVWIGLTQPRWWPTACALPAALALSIAFAIEGAGISIASTLNMVVFAALIGELVAWVKQSDQARSDDLGLVIDGTGQLRSETDRAAAARRLVETVVALLRVPNVAVYLPETDGRCSLVASAGTVPWETERPTAIGGIAVRAVAAGTELSIPLVGRSGCPRGLVVAAGRRRQDEFMLRLAQILGEQAGYQLDDLAQFDALADESRRDPLTGVGNRRFADEVLHDLCDGDAVAVVDLDDLRGINARVGHQGGDEAIRAIARHLTDSVRAVDVVARLGGDEFVVVLRGAGQAALALVDRVTADWNDAHADATFSTGVTVHRGGDPEATLRAADAALFSAKRRGRAQSYAAPVEVEDAAGF
jgi:diguanylate cyclase (GGDEF)-like protein